MANGAIQEASVTFGLELRDAITGTTNISVPVAFLGTGVRTLTLSGTGRGDNQFLLELGDASASGLTSLFKTSSGNWVLGKSNPYSGLTTLQEGNLVVTRNDALGTKGRSVIINPSTSVFTGDANLPNGTPVTFPLFATTTLPGGILADTQYYVVGSSGNTFQVATSPNGTPLTITSSGTNVQFVPKIESVRSTSLSVGTGVFTGYAPVGSVVTFNTKLSPTTIVLPTGLDTNTPYYVVSSENGTFTVSATPGGAVKTFSGTSTPDSLFYTTNAVGNAGAGVYLSGGTLELRDVDYITPEQLIFEGGALAVPLAKNASWSGDLMINHYNSRITVGANGTLTLNGNIFGNRGINQEGEGTLIMRGESIAPTTNVSNNLREYAVRAGTLVLDYTLNNASKLVDNALLRLGGTRRGGTLVLRGGSHEEIVSQLNLEAGASKIYREVGSTSTIRLNTVNRSTGSSLYVDTGRVAKVDNLNYNGILGAWAIIRDAITNPYWVIPGTSSFNYTATANPTTNQIGTGVSHVVRNGMVVTFATAGTMPGNLIAGEPYYVVLGQGFGARLQVSETYNGQPVDILTAGAGTLSLTAHLAAQPNAGTDTFSTFDGHGLANGVKVRVSSFGQLPAGLSAVTDYYVVSSENRSFRLSLALDGQPVDFTTNGTRAFIVETQGTERRSGPAALTFSVNPDFAPAADGNGRVKVMIQNSGAGGSITSNLTGQGIVSDPYVYTIIATTNNNSNQAIASFVANDQVGAVKISNVLAATSSTSSPTGLLYPQFANFTDLNSYAVPAGAVLAGGTYDNGSVELDWARNAGVPGSPTTTNDGFIMPNSSYNTAWGSGVNTGITGSTAVSDPTSTFSVRFANQVASTVSLLDAGLYPIRTGGILVSPTVGANDSTFTGLGVLTSENQGNLQNFLFHQHNPLGSLIVDNKITNRQAFARAARLTGTSRRYLTMSVNLAGLQVVPGWSLPVTTGINTGIAANTKVESILQNRLIILDSNHNGTQFDQHYVFASPGSITINADQALPPGHPGLTQITGLTTTADIVVGMTVTGTGISAGTTVTGIVNGTTVLLSQGNDTTFHSGAYVFTDGVTVISRSAMVNEPNHYLITGLASTADLALGMSVSGAGISPGTIIVEKSASPAYVRLNQIHDGVYRTGVTYTFNGDIDKSGTLPTAVAIRGVSADPNRRILDGVASTTGITPGVTVTGAGIPASTTVELVLDGHTLYLSQNHDGGFRRGNYSFSGGSLPPQGVVRAASVPNADRRIVMGVVIPAQGVNPSTVSTNDLYIGMPISGPGIPFGSTITFIYNDSDIQVSTNHFFTSESTTLTFTPTTGVEKLGAGSLVLNGASDYTGVTFIADGAIRANLLTDGGVPGSLGASNGGSGNLVFNGGELQYVGENGQTNRGFTVADFATINVGHERTSATFSGAITSGTDRLNKSGPGTLELNGNANLATIRVQQGRLLLQTVDTNPAPGAFSPTNFSQSALTSMMLGGGTLELRGTPEGNVTQNFGSQLTIETGATILKVTSVPASSLEALTTPFTRLNLMGQEEITPVIRQPGGTVSFVENPQGNGSADIFLFLPIEERQKVIPWATYQDTTSASPGINQFATVLQATSATETTGGELVSAGSIGLYDIGSGLLNPGNWMSVRSAAGGFDVSEGALSLEGQPLAFNGNIDDFSGDRFARTIRFVTAVDGSINIAASRTLELVGGAILAGTNVFGGQKSINGPGNITGGALNDVNSDFIMHNYNPITPFTIGANIVDRSVKSATSSGLVGKGQIKTGETQMKISLSLLPTDFFTRVRAGMKVSGAGIQTGTVVEAVEINFQRLILSLPATEDHLDAIFTFTDTTNFIQTGTGTTILAGNNTYTGNTFVHGGVLRLNSANAVPGGIGATGGTSALIVEDGIIGLGAGNFNRPLGTGISEIQFSGNGGFAAYGADRTVNLGGGAVPDTLRFGNNGFVPDGSSLILGSRDATHKVIFANPIDLSAFSQAIRVENSSIAVEAELSGSLSGLGRLIKFGLGTLRLGVSNANLGGIEIAEGRLIAANVTNVFGAASGAVRLGSSLTNTTTQAGIDLVVEGGTAQAPGVVANPLLVGSTNARGAQWIAGGVMEASQGDPQVGEEASAAIVNGYPAVAYYDTTNQDLKYVRALDTRGATWGAPVTIASRGNVGRNPSLQIINGNPAIAYHDQTAGMLMFVRATDAQGVIWGTPISVLGQPTPAAVAVDTHGRIIVGGGFTRFDGQIRNRLVRLSPPVTLGDPFKLEELSTFNANIMNGEVRTILVLPNEKILVGGTFTAVRENGTAPLDITRNRIAVFNTNGSLDLTINPNANGDVRIFVRQSDGKIMVGGAFTTVAGVGRTRMARLNANITLDTSFANTDIRNGEVRAIIPEDRNTNTAGFETYTIAGTFTDIRGVGRNRLARVNADASLAAFNPDANNTVMDMVRLPGGKYLLGGSFTAFAGSVVARTRLARLNDDGTVDEGFGQEVNGEVRDLHLEANGDVLVAGVFSQLGDYTRSFVGRVLANGTVDMGFAPEPDFEAKQITTMVDGKIVMAGSFNSISGTTQQLVARILPTGANDPAFSRFIVNAGLYSSLYNVNGNPAVAFHNSTDGDLYYIRSTDANGGGWPNPELIDSGAAVSDTVGAAASTAVGVGISMTVANLGGDLLTKDNRGTETTDDDEVTVSGTAATSGTPVIAYGDATNSRIRYVVANNVNGAGNGGVGLGESMTNWSLPKEIPGLDGPVSKHFTLNVVDGSPALTYQTTDTMDLKYIRALNSAGVTHNLRDSATSEVLRILVSQLTFSTATSWGTPVVLDFVGDVGSFPSLAMINGQPTTTKNRPAVAYYDATNGDLKYVASSDSTGAAWDAPTTLVSVDDVGRAATLLFTEGLPAVSYYNATKADLEFVILNNASGYSRIALNGNTNWSGNVTFNGMTTLAPALGTVTQFTGLITGTAGFRLAGGGTLNIAPNQRQILLADTTALTGGWGISGPGLTVGSTLAVVDSFNRMITLDRDHDGVSRTATYTLTPPVGDNENEARNIEGTVLVGNTFASSLRSPGMTTGPGRAVDGGVVIRSGTILFSGTNALSSATIEMGDQISQEISVGRATNSVSVLNHGGSFNAKHDGTNINANGPGAFVRVSASIDGQYYGLVATTADSNADRFTGNLPNGTAIRLRASLLPTGVASDTVYYVRNSAAGQFQISATPTGTVVNFFDEGVNIFYILQSSLDAKILVKDEAANPERNGIYRVAITTDNELITFNEINLVRVAELDSVGEMVFGVRVNVSGVSGGTHQGQSFYIGSTVTDLNISAVHWIQDTAASDVALLANAAGVTVGNAIDINAIPGSVSTILGANSTVTSGQVFFNGPITLQNQAMAAQELETLELRSFTSDGFGVRFNGAITESSTLDALVPDAPENMPQDRLSLIKTGSGTVTLGGNSTFKGGISINQGTLYVMNNTAIALPGQSGTGTGPVTVNAGTVLGGIGSIGGSVTMSGTLGSPAILRPGDPTTNNAPVEALTINGPLVVGANSVVEFTLGVNNLTQLVGNSMNLSTETSKIVVQFADGFLPEVGATFQILNLVNDLVVFGGAQNLLNLLQLPINKVWNTDRFITEGILEVVGDPTPIVITPGSPASATRTQGQQHAFTVVFTGSGPVSIRWQKTAIAGPDNWQDIPGATGSTYTIPSVTDANDEARYRARVSNVVNTQFSEPATLIVNWPLGFVQDLPAKRVASVGSPLVLSVVVAGESPTFDWQKNGVSLGAPSSPTLPIPGSSVTMETTPGQYRVVVTNPLNATTGITSVATTVTVTAGEAVVSVMPESQIVLAGSTVTLTSMAGGVPTGRVTSWLKGSAVILGEFTETLVLPNITVAQAGDYKFKVVNTFNGKTNTAISDPADVVVVENPNRVVAAQIGKAVTFKVAIGAGKAKPGYEWLMNGQPLNTATDPTKYKGTTTAALTINKLTAADMATYSLRVKRVPSNPSSDFVIGGTHFLRVFDAAPEIDETMPPPPKGMVGTAYSWKIPATSDVAATESDPQPAAWKKAPTVYKMVPAKVDPTTNPVAGVALASLGLKLDPATGYITGRPTAATKNTVDGDLYVVSVENAVKPVDTWNVRLLIKPLPIGMEGVYAGPIERSAALNSRLGGRFDMTITKAGAYSGKVILGTDAARAFSGAFVMNLDSEGNLVGAPSTSVTILGTKTSPPLTIAFTLSITDPVTLGDPKITRLVPATISYRTDSVNFTAWRNIFVAAKPVAGMSKLPTDYLIKVVTPDKPDTYKPALYNFAMTLATTDPLVGNLNVPQGAGYAAFTVAAAGTYSLAGRTADNQTITGSYWVGPAGDMFIYQTLYAAVKTIPTKGSLLGQLKIEVNSDTTSDDNDLSGNLTWVRPAEALNSKGRQYKAGFGLPDNTVGVTSPVNLIAFGGRFITPAAEATVLGAPTDTASLEYSEDGNFIPAGDDVDSATNPNQLNNIRLAKGSVVTMANKILPANPALNPTLTTVTVNKATGLLGGGFTLSDTVAGKVVPRKTTQFGLTIRRRTSDLGVEPRTTMTYGLGYFILDELAPTAALQKVAPQRSGIFNFTD